MKEQSFPSAGEQIEYLATKVMGWEKKTYGAGAYGHWNNISGSKEYSLSGWNPLTNWNHWHQIEEEIVMNADLWNEFIRELGMPDVRTPFVSTNLFAQCGLKTRVIALIAAHQNLYAN